MILSSINKNRVITLYKHGKVSLREAAELSNLSAREMIDVLLAHGVKGNIDYDTQKKSLEIIKTIKLN